MQDSKTEIEPKGLIFNIQKFCVHDGPGIRTTVFLKGCPLRCPWCSNPESQDFSINLMVRDINCKSCGACVKVCPQGAISISGQDKRTIDWNKCNSCLICVDSCLYHSLNKCGWQATVRDVLEEFVQDLPFYENSGGGVTISGGEPLSQNIFAKEILTECKKVGLHTALETTGYAPWRKLQEVLIHVDLVLFDIKHLDPVKHQKTTGVNNDLILENLRKTAKSNQVWLRIPLISGFNDSESHIKEIAILGKNIGVKKVSLLPYHEGGKTKCEQLGRSYCCPDERAPDEEHILKLKKIIEGIGLVVSIGN
ncbi:MAG: glycyl-radical enzyme activating protein [Candidatus Lokiarchaeota archaeon]|nr:glycyl-radical enzyme activating protein [Candidatus Lokiarchaeota archaeon]